MTNNFLQLINIKQQQKQYITRIYMKIISALIYIFFVVQNVLEVRKYTVNYTPQCAKIYLRTHCGTFQETSTLVKF